MSEAKAITWTVEEQPPPVRRRVRLGIVHGNNSWTLAAPSDLARAIASLSEEQRREYATALPPDIHSPVAWDAVVDARDKARAELAAEREAHQRTIDAHKSDFDRVGRVIRAMADWTPECRAGLAKEIGERWTELAVGPGALNAAMVRTETAEKTLRDTLDRLRTIIDEAFGMQPFIPEAELLSLLEKLLWERGRRENAVLTRAETAENERDAHDKLAATAIDAFYRCDRQRIDAESDRDSLRAELDRVRGVVEAAKRMTGSRCSASEYIAFKAAVDALSASTSGEKERCDHVSELWGQQLQCVKEKAHDGPHRCNMATSAPRPEEPITVELTHLEKLHANANIDRREFEEAMRSAFPMMAAEIRRARAAALRPKETAREAWERGTYAQRAHDERKAALGYRTFEIVPYTPPATDAKETQR